MSVPDPTQGGGPDRPVQLARRFWRILRWLSLFAIAFAALAVAAVMRGEPEFKVHMAIATALGAGLSVLVGGALMTLMFLSARHGHDADAARPPEKDDQ